MSFILKAVISAVLNFFWARVEQWRREFAKKEEGRAEIRDAVNKKTEETKDEWKEIERSSISADDAIGRLRVRATGGDNSVPVPGKPNK